MAFDPFGDFEKHGYLRNIAREKDPDKVKNHEHVAFRGNVRDALKELKDKPSIDYQDLKDTHNKLFGDFYPWAGKDRAETAPDIAISKAGHSDLFAHPQDVGRAADFALKMGNDQSKMKTEPGRVLGELAHAHPFLDGNGRAIMTVHSELLRRADRHIDWHEISKDDFLKALTKELQDPGRGHLDDLIRPHLREGTLETDKSAEQLRTLGKTEPQENAKEEANREAVEAAIERSLRRQYRDAPELVERGMAAARKDLDKRAARGEKLPDVKISESRNTDRDQDLER